MTAAIEMSRHILIDGERPKTLLIIGNGFDLNMGLKTSYRNFVNSQYCPFGNNRCVLSRGIGPYLNRKSKEYWFDLEQSLKDYCSKKRIQCKHLQSRVLKDFDSLIDALRLFLIKAEEGVIRQDSEATRILHACCDNKNPADIVSFNYTDLCLLAKRVGIDLCSPPDTIHGTLRDNNIVLGFDETETISDCLSPLFKSRQKGYDPKSLTCISDYPNIIIFGLSINPIDFPHFKKFFFNLFENGTEGKNIWLIVHGKNSVNQNYNSIHNLTKKSIHELKSSSVFKVIDVETETGKQEIDHICKLINP